RLSVAIASMTPRFSPGWPLGAGGVVPFLAALLLWGPLSAIAPRALGQSGDGPQPIPLSAPPSEVATQILHQAILQSVWGPPAYCAVRQSVQVFGKQLRGVGTYFRGGQGSGKLRFSLRLPAADQLNTLLQVSDGQRLLSIESIGETRRRTEIDLGKVRPRLILTNDSLRDPIVAMYLAIGGQAEALRKLYQQYGWVAVREGQLGEIDVWWLSGQLPPQPPRLRSVALADDQLFQENGSGLLPTKVQLAIGKQNSALPFWLYQVEQTRTLEELSPAGRSTQLRIITEWAEPMVLEAGQLTPQLFEPPSSNEPLFDETSRYLPPAPAVAAGPPTDLVR
ncbi:MAG: hypothetical protein KDA45_15145, partial [Planctomycetales bacterium]|nr:hypothetical protein [Planctomycetales bacterium]